MMTYVDYSTAKLLKEKGFEEPVNNCFVYYLKTNKSDNPSFNIKKGEIEEHDGYFKNNCHSDLSNKNYTCYSKPTIAEVVMWLYEKHGIWISVNKDFDNGVCLGFEAIINGNDGIVDCGTFKSPTEAYESAIKYCLTNIIIIH